MPGGRPSKLTPEVADRIVAAVAGGAPLRLAAAHGGIGERTLHRWLEVGEAARRGAYRQFWQRVEAARAGYFVEMGEVVREGAVTDARTAPLRCRPGAPARVDLQVSGQLQVRDDEAGLALLLLDRDWCERTQDPGRPARRHRRPPEAQCCRPCARAGRAQRRAGQRGAPITPASCGKVYDCIWSPPRSLLQGRGASLADGCHPVLTRGA